MIKIAIITTIPTEYQQFINLLNQRVKKTEEFIFRNSQKVIKYQQENVEIYLTISDNAGLVNASLTTSHIINELTPDYLILAGISGGFSERGIKLGDIIVSNQILDFSNQKLIEDKRSFKTKTYSISANLLRKAKSINKDEWLLSVNNKSEKELIKKANIHFGTIASSNSVVTSTSEINTLLEFNRDIIGIEMEGAGVAAAVQNSNSNIEYIVIRSVSDTISEKSDKSQSIASYLAASFTLELVFQQILPKKEESRNQRDINLENSTSYDVEFKTGAGTFLKRKFDLENSYLNSKSYAKALSEILMDSKGEFCFALLGHWGRGKTYLMHLTARELQNSHENFWFSAWKYKTKPELWVYLYENIREKINKVSFFKRIPLIFQGRLLQFGYLPIIIFILSFAIALIPFGSVILYLMGIFGIIGLIKIFRLYTIGKNKFSGIKKFVFLSKFSDQLGLQALLGKELKYLLLGFFNKAKFSRSEKIKGIFLYLISVVIFNLCLLWGLNEENSIKLFSQLGNFAMYPSGIGLIKIAIAVNIIFITFPIWLLCTKNEKHKALLIVDDLDRVSPNEMLDIIESLKLFLEDEEISEVLQIVMIFEEDTFNAALSNKYSALIDGKKNIERVVNENMQKLFIAHLTLPPLNIAECIEYTSMFLDYQITDYEYNSNVINKVNPKSRTIYSSNEYSRLDDSVKKDLKSPSSIKEFDIEELTNDEKKAIINSLKYFNESESNSIKLGPRAIQSFIIKYKLGRKLLDARGQYKVNPELLTNLLAQRIINKNVKLERLELTNIDYTVLRDVLNEIT